MGGETGGEEVHAGRQAKRTIPPRCPDRAVVLNEGYLRTAVEAFIKHADIGGEDEFVALHALMPEKVFEGGPGTFDRNAAAEFLPELTRQRLFPRSPNSMEPPGGRTPFTVPSSRVISTARRRLSRQTSPSTFTWIFCGGRQVCMSCSSQGLAGRDAQP
jgi:hypothetical protein